MITITPTPTLTHTPTLTSTQAPNHDLPRHITDSRCIALITLVGSGLCDKEIADRLSISHLSVRVYLNYARTRLGLQNTTRQQLTLWCIREGLTSTPELMLTITHLPNLSTATSV